jgi:hypothetical protein
VRYLEQGNVSLVMEARRSGADGEERISERPLLSGLCVVSFWTSYKF